VISGKIQQNGAVSNRLHFDSREQGGSGPLLRFGQMLGDVTSLPEKCGMLTNAFDNLGLFGKQQFWLVSAGSYRFEVGSFGAMVQHGREQRRNGFKHLIGSRPIIGSEERIESPFEFLLVQDLESIHVIRAEIMVHRARKKDRKLPEQFGVVGELRNGKAIEVVEIPRVVPVNHGLCLATEQFLDFQNEVTARCSIPDGYGVQLMRRQCAGSHQEVDFDLDAVGSAGVIFKIEVPLAQGVVVHAVLKLVAKAGGDLFDSLDDLWTVLECWLAIDMPDVVEIDIDRKPCEIEVKEIECGSALEYQFSFENRVPVKLDKEFPQPEHLLEIFSGEAGVLGQFANLRRSEIHVCTEPVREGENVSGTMSFHVGTQRCPGRLSAR
jgi:hypothetical protein